MCTRYTLSVYMRILCDCDNIKINSAGPYRRLCRILNPYRNPSEHRQKRMTFKTYLAQHFRWAYIHSRSRICLHDYFEVDFLPYWQNSSHHFFCVNATIGMENANNFHAAQMNSHFISSVNSIYDVRTRNMQRSVEQKSCDKKEHRSHIAICMHYIC